MPGFHYHQHILTCDGLPLTEIAQAAGTPCYVYSGGLIRARYAELAAAFSGYPHAFHYALKANSTFALVRLLRELGSQADANSVGEIELALRAGFTPAQIVFTGVGKTRAELERAVSLGLKAINAESRGELARIDAIAQGPGEARARGAAHQSGRRRADPSAHLDRPEAQQVRRPARRRARDAARDEVNSRGWRSSASTSTSVRR